MATIHQTIKATETNEERRGLLAIGSAGSWVIDVDEVLPDGVRWRAQIEGPSISLDFEISSLDVFDKLAQFLKADPHGTTPSNGSASRGEALLLGGNDRTPVRLVKDDEYVDRFFLVVGQPDNVIAWITISGKDASEMAEAALQVNEELDDEP